MEIPFYDRYGRAHYINDEIPRRKKGYFAVLLKDDKVLITYPPRVNVPEFPGGGISRQEDFKYCLSRKLYEETGIEFMLAEGKQTYAQEIYYYADDEKQVGNFCIYDQIYSVYDATSFGMDTLKKMWKTPEGGQAVWVNVNNIISGKLKISYPHWQAFQKLFLEDDETSD